MDGYTLTIGIECHVQFNTATKLFSGSSNDDRNAKPNTLVNQIDFGLPGELPVLNKAAIEKAVRAAFALNTRPAKYSTFDRKHYFYPDLPMGYQITQYNQPIIAGGNVEISINGKTKLIGITRAHLEADAGKSIHPANKDYSLVDLNRAGTPLLEIVSEPEMHSAAEAKAYARELWMLMRFANVSNANLYYGNMRFDVNVSLSKDSTLGTRTETKNLNSFRSVERAIEYEAKRQLQLLKNGESITQETRGWDDVKGETYSLRTKENADDYRYMPDPDLPPIELTEEYIKQIEANMPTLPKAWRAKLAKHNLPESTVDVLLQNEVEYSGGDIEYIDSLDGAAAKVVANFIINYEIPYRQTSEVKLANVDRHRLYGEVQDLINKGKLNSTSAKSLIIKLLGDSSLPESIEEHAASSRLLQQSDEAGLAEMVSKVIKDNPKAASDIKSGEHKAIGFLVGMVMKETSNQANPSVVRSLIEKELGIS